MVAGIIMAFFVAIVYCWFIRRNITIKMPDGGPPNVANAFTALIPGAAIMTMVAIVFGIFRAFDTTMVQAIYTTIQTPLQGLSDTLPGILVIAFLIPFLWFFGVHGSSIVGGVINPIALANTLHNQALVDQYGFVSLENGGRIFTDQFKQNYIIMTGAGVTIGLVFFMLVFAKSAHFKTLGRLGAGPAVFNINEPITFGTPIVMNPLLFIPFVITPMVNATLLYLAMSAGILPLFTGVMAPWTTPPIISGFIIGGWKHALFQAFLLVLSIVIYFPFARKVDQMAYADELAAHEAHVHEAEELEHKAHEAEELAAEKARVEAELAELDARKRAQE